MQFFERHKSFLAPQTKQQLREDPDRQDKNKDESKIDKYSQDNGQTQKDSGEFHFNLLIIDLFYFKQIKCFFTK